MLVNLRLVGDIGDQFGYHHQFEVITAREVIVALRANCQGFRQYLVNAASKGLDYELVADGMPWAEDDLKSRAAPSSMVLAPVLAGAGAVGKIIAGVALIGLSVFAPFSIGLLGAGVVTSGQIGAALLLSGVSEALREPDNKKTSSTGINAIGTITDGDIIPIAYGRVFITGKVISAGTTVSRR
jgi:predicted phage tail protein